MSLAEMPTLEKVHIGNANGWSDYKMDALVKLPGITELTMQRCCLILAPGFANVREGEEGKKGWNLGWICDVLCMCSMYGMYV